MWYGCTTGEPGGTPKAILHSALSLSEGLEEESAASKFAVEWPPEAGDPGWASWQRMIAL